MSPVSISTLERYPQILTFQGFRPLLLIQKAEAGSPETVLVPGLVRPRPPSDARDSPMPSAGGQ